jgi:hypothetical protein
MHGGKIIKLVGTSICFQIVINKWQTYCNALFGKRNFVLRVFTKKTVLSAKQQLYNFTDPLNPGGLAYNGKDAKSFPQFFP